MAAIVVAVAIVVIIGIFRWKRASENPIKAMARQSRKMYAERNMARNERDKPDACAFSDFFIDTFYITNFNHDEE